MKQLKKYLKLKSSLLIAIVILLFSCSSKSQKKGIFKKEILTKEDSVIIVKYLEKAQSFSLFSPERQMYFDSVLSIVKDNAFLWQQKAMPYFKQMKYGSGMPFLDTAVLINEKDYIDYRGFIKCIFSKEYIAAIKDFQRARTIKGEIGIMDHSYLFYIGLSYLQLNELEKAGLYIDSSIFIGIKNSGRPHFLELFYSGVIKHEKREYINAIASFDSTLKIYENFSDAKYYKAQCLAAQSKYADAYSLVKEAEADFKAGYTINEDNAVYERYPYQIRTFLLSNSIARFEQMLKKSE